MKTKNDMIQRALELKLYQIQSYIIDQMMQGRHEQYIFFGKEEIPLFMDDLIKILRKEFNVTFKQMSEGSSSWELVITW
jgi:hypothetical protein